MSAVLLRSRIFHEGLDTALVFHLLALFDRMALVGENNDDAGIQKCQLAQAMLERSKVKLDHGEGLRATEGM